jgi:hypothetical protein
VGVIADFVGELVAVPPANTSTCLKPVLRMRVFNLSAAEIASSGLANCTLQQLQFFKRIKSLELVRLECTQNTCYPLKEELLEFDCQVFLQPLHHELYQTSRTICSCLMN